MLKYVLATTSFISQIRLPPGEQIIKFCLKFFRANCGFITPDEAAAA
jgi:hypothetical protein